MKHIPNLLTVLRIALVPVFLYFVVTGELYEAAAIFIIAGVTDGIDGFLARRYNSRTEFGANMDPFADKFLLMSAYIALTAKGLLPLWLTIPVVLKDSFLLTGFMALRGMGRKVAASPSLFGKSTTVLQILTVVYAMLIGRDDFFPFLAGATALITVYTWIDYSRREYLIQTGRK
ncbi:CDP-alcohol phosphatidyltransferase family protein [bacterium]|nr:CDP-alcohol phosphatidyltransferase family protein [bacterium]